MGSLFYCFAFDYFSVALVVTVSNLYIVITTLLGIVVLSERVTALKIAGLACIVLGVVLLAHSRARYAVTSEAASSDKKMAGLRALGSIATYVIIVGIGLSSSTRVRDGAATGVRGQGTHARRRRVRPT